MREDGALCQPWLLLSASIRHMEAKDGYTFLRLFLHASPYTSPYIKQPCLVQEVEKAGTG